LSRVESLVAARHRQPVRFANRRAGDDLGAEVEIHRHAPDDRELLVVLLAEHRDIGAGRSEQLRDDRRHAVEMARPTGAFHGGRERARHDPGLETRGVHRGGGRGIHRIDRCVGARGEVGLEHLWVAGEVGGIAELERVDEDGHHHEVCTCVRQVDQGKVPVVERSHRRHQRHRSARNVRVE
jgi:hypothetical protein